MNYLTEQDLRAAIPADLIQRATDDNLDGAADPVDGASGDLLSLILAAASRRVDALVSPVIIPESTTVHPVAAFAALAFAGEDIYRRARISDDANPWISPAKNAAAKLARISAGAEPLTAPSGSTGAAGAGYEAPADRFTDAALASL